MRTYTQIIDALKASEATTHPRLNIFTQDVEDEPNRTHAYAEPVHTSDLDGTLIAYVQTTFEHLKDTWAVSAYVHIANAYHWEDTTKPRLKFDISTLSNISARADYGYSPRPTDAQRRAAHKAIGAVLGTDGEEHLTIPRRTVDAMIVRRLIRAAQHVTPDSIAPGNYARAVSSAIERELYDVTRYNDSKVYGVDYTPEQLDALAVKARRSHKRNLYALAKAL